MSFSVTTFGFSVGFAVAFTAFGGSVVLAFGFVNALEVFYFSLAVWKVRRRFGAILTASCERTSAHFWVDNVNRVCLGNFCEVLW